MGKIKGSVKKHKHSWYYVIDIGRDESGRRKQKKKGGFTTKENALDELYKVNVELGYLPDLTSSLNENVVEEEINPKDIRKSKSNKNKGIHITTLPEKIIEEILLKDIEIIEKGMKVVQNQAFIDGNYIDILARDKKGILCIVEIKNNTNDRSSPYQSILYPIKLGKECRMIIVSTDYDENLLTVLNIINEKIQKLEILQLVCEQNVFKVIPFVRRGDDIE